MKERILQFLKAENKSSAQFAEEIGVQPSGISHILSGRNNPSLDFVCKMLEKYPWLSTEWLLFGKGSMYKDKSMQNLSDELPLSEFVNVEEKAEKDDALDTNLHPDEKLPAKTGFFSTGIEKIVFFYRDNSFREYVPRQEKT
ncbi:MAG: helix-turn-helix transcriptional regulator [Bacteroidales bacterium]|nr:helix-turn-helix transcriptional regulator [Bacteroidales bacterium]